MNSGRIKIAVDTSSLIYLHKSNLLERSSSVYRFVTCPKVWVELLRGITTDEIQTFAAHIEIILVFLFSEKWGKSALSAADKGLIELYFQHACAAVLSEDGHILRYCQRNDISHYCALSLLPQLTQKGLLTKEEANNQFQNLLKIGRYSPRIVEYAKSLLKSEVQP